MSVLRNRKQNRQLFAYTNFTSFSGSKEKYKALVEKMGMMIYTNGIVSTIAHLKAKNDDEYKTLYTHFSEWIINENPVTGFSIGNDDDLLERVLGIEDSRLLLALTKEYLLLSDALKEIVKAES
jgi:CRISPR type III-B/RAMP module-associated protein Cmr5